MLVASQSGEEYHIGMSCVCVWQGQRGAGNTTGSSIYLGDRVFCFISNFHENWSHSWGNYTSSMVSIHSYPIISNDYMFQSS